MNLSCVCIKCIAGHWSILSHSKPILNRSRSQITRQIYSRFPAWFLIVFLCCCRLWHYKTCPWPRLLFHLHWHLKVQQKSVAMIHRPPQVFAGWVNTHKLLWPVIALYGLSGHSCHPQPWLYGLCTFLNKDEGFLATPVGYMLFLDSFYLLTVLIVIKAMYRLQGPRILLRSLSSTVSPFGH